LYFLLVPWLGINGSAVAYVIGTICQLGLTVLLSGTSSLKMNYKEGIILSIIPFAIGAIALIFDLNFILSLFIIYLASLVAYVRLHYFTEKELHLIVYSTLSQKYADKFYNVLYKVFKRIQ
jgi:hypothetical protein